MMSTSLLLEWGLMGRDKNTSARLCANCKRSKTGAGEGLGMRLGTWYVLWWHLVHSMVALGTYYGGTWYTLWWHLVHTMVALGTHYHCKNKIVILAKYLVTIQLRDYHSCANSKNLVLVKHFVGGK